jgi:hypothetical protein
MAKKSSALSRLITSIEVKDENGTLSVPVSKESNSLANKVLITRIRTMIEESIKEWKMKGLSLTPKELRELAGAARDVADSSNLIYGDGEDIVDPSSKPEKDAEQVSPEAIDFSNLKPENADTESKGNP